ncbi:MAG: T9SS type A sorting domain-containing protein [Cryomorphaceae bacterium]
MKRGFIVALLCLLFHGLNAQVNHPFIDTNSAWRLSEFYYDGLNPPSYHYADIAFDKNSYQESDSFRFARASSYFEPRLLVYIEEQTTGRVFVSDTNGTDTILLYDFSAEVGDSIIYRGLEEYAYYTECAYLGPWSDSSLLVVTHVDTIGSRKIIQMDRFNFMDTLEYPSYPYLHECGSIEWIEGVGKLIEPFYTNAGFVEYSVNVDCYLQEGAPVEIEGYLDSICTPLGQRDITRSAIRIFPNPSSGNLNIEGTNARHAELYDLSGRIVGVFQLTGSSIDVSGISPGVYLLQIGEEVHKIVLR